MITPINPQAIDDDPSVKHSFQADENFNIIHESSTDARPSIEASPVCVQIANELAEVAGFPPIDRIVATSHESRLMIFSLASENAEPPGPRIFGLTTDPSIQLNDAVRFISPLL